jgi:hypothetical protein
MKRTLALAKSPVRKSIIEGRRIQVVPRCAHAFEADTAYQTLFPSGFGRPDDALGIKRRIGHPGGDSTSGGFD